MNGITKGSILLIVDAEKAREAKRFFKSLESQTDTTKAPDQLDMDELFGLLNQMRADRERQEPKDMAFYFESERERSQFMELLHAPDPIAFLDSL